MLEQQRSSCHTFEYGDARMLLVARRSRSMVIVVVNNVKYDAILVSSSPRIHFSVPIRKPLVTCSMFTKGRLD